MLKKIKELFNRRNLVVYKLRKYLRKLYEGYPTHFFYNYEKINGIENGIKNLIDDGIIIGEDFQNGYKTGKTPVYRLTTFEQIIQKRYRLTADGLKLVEDWNSQRLTFIGLIVSLIILALTIYSIWLSLFLSTPAI